MKNTEAYEQKIAWVQKAYKYHLSGQYEEAIFACNQALQIDKTFARAHFGRALAFYRLGQTEFALSSLKQTIRYNRNHIRAYILAGNIYYQQRHYKRAIRAYNLALKIDPIDKDALDGKVKSEVCQTKQDQENSEKDKQSQEQQRLLELEIIKHVSSGDEYYNSNDYESAIKEYNAVLQLDPHNLAVLQKRVEIYDILRPKGVEDHSIKYYVIGKDGFVERVDG